MVGIDYLFMYLLVGAAITLIVHKLSPGDLINGPESVLLSCFAWPIYLVILYRQVRDRSRRDHEAKAALKLRLRAH